MIGTVRQAARFCGCKHHVLYEACRYGGVKSEKRGGKYYFNEDHLIEWVKRGKPKFPDRMQGLSNLASRDGINVFDLDRHRPKTFEEQTISLQDAIGSVPYWELHIIDAIKDGSIYTHEDPESGNLRLDAKSFDDWRSSTRKQAWKASEKFISGTQLAPEDEQAIREASKQFSPGYEEYINDAYSALERIRINCRNRQNEGGGPLSRDDLMPDVSKIQTAMFALIEASQTSTQQAKLPI